MNLQEKMLRARESNVDIDGHQITIRCPSDYEALILGNSEDPKAMLKQCVVGWDMKEVDLIPGGSATVVPFSIDVFMLWIENNLPVWEKLIEAISEAYQRDKKSRDDALGKPEAG